MSEETAAWVGAGAAVGAGLIVAWQSWETRRSVQAANAAVRAANDGLDLSRQQIAEAVRARIDSLTPTITVVVGKVVWPPVEPSVVPGGTAQPLPYGTDSPELHMPRDAERRIGVRAAVSIQNDSSQHVTLSIGGFHAPDGEVFLKPGSVFADAVEVVRPLREWVDIYRTRAMSEPGPEHRASVVYLGHGDTSASDYWTIVFGGTPVEPHPAFEGGWRIAGSPGPLDGRPSSMGVGVEPRVRTYWLSKSRGERLPD